MCGRYQFTYTAQKEDPQLSSALLSAITQHMQGEIFPSQSVLIFYGTSQGACAAIASWGFRYQKKRIINARLETLQERKLFASYAHLRCVLPCDCYFEWQTSKMGKRRMKIAHPSLKRLYLAGIYNEHMEACVLTMKARGSLAAIHDRMPIVLDAQGMRAYLAGCQGVATINAQLVAREADPAI